jgi:hypothetical protein
MEKQRKYPEQQSCRRLLKQFLKGFLVALLFAAGSQTLYSQTLTNALIRDLRISPVQNQPHAVNTDIKFEVVIPYTLPSQIDVSMPEEPENVVFKTLRKVESGESGGGTKIELWFSFSKTGTYILSPLTVKIKNSRRQIPFMPVKIGINPKEQEPLCIIVTENGMNKNLTVAAGQTVKFRVCLQYAVQLVQFNWELPKDSIFVQGKTYEFTEIKQREKVVSDELIPVSDFEWTPLVTGTIDFPKFNIQAIAYNGDKVTVKLPAIKVNVVKARTKKSDNSSSYFSKAFETDFENGGEELVLILTAQEAEYIAELRSKERHSLFGKARKERIAYEKMLGMPYSQKEFKIAWIYICVVITLALVVLLVIFLRKKRSIINIGIGIALVCMIVLVIYCAVCGKRKFAVSTGGQLCSIPEASASIKSELPVCNSVQVLDESGDWYLLRFGETEGWCTKESIIIIK